MVGVALSLSLQTFLFLALVPSGVKKLSKNPARKKQVYCLNLIIGQNKIPGTLF